MLYSNMNVIKLCPGREYSLHDRSLVKKFTAFSVRGMLIHCFDSTAHLWMTFHNITYNAFIYHSKTTLAQLSEQLHLLPGHLPLIRLIHC